MVLASPVRNGIKVGLQLLLGDEVLRMGGIGGEVICIQSKVNIGWRSGNVRGVEIEEGRREDTALWTTSFGD